MTRQADSKFADLAALAEYATGELERRANMEQLARLESVELVDDALVFANYHLKRGEANQIVARGIHATLDDIRQKPMRGGYAYTWVPIKRGLLERFAGLHDCSDQAILSYARDWGGLMICSHNLPCSHRPFSTPFDPEFSHCSPRGWGGHSWWEPLQAWRDLSRQAFAMLRIAIALNDGTRGSMGDWKHLSRGLGPFPPVEPKTLGDEWALLGRKVNEWLVIGQVGPRMRPTKSGSPVLRVGGRSLFGAIAYQLALAVSGSSGAAICSSCKAVYAPSRRPAPGRRTYCPKCREAGRPVQDAQRDKRRRAAATRGTTGNQKLLATSRAGRRASRLSKRDS